jgi:hypothetical protein
VEEVEADLLKFYQEVPQQYRIVEEEDLMMLRKLQEYDYMKRGEKEKIYN